MFNLQQQVDETKTESEYQLRLKDNKYSEDARLAKKKFAAELNELKQTISKSPILKDDTHGLKEALNNSRCTKSGHRLLPIVKARSVLASTGHFLQQNLLQNFTTKRLFTLLQHSIILKTIREVGLLNALRL